MYQDKYFLLEAAHESGSASGASGAGQSAPLPQGSHGRPATLDEALDALLSTLKRNVRIIVSPTQRPVAIPGDPLTATGPVQIGTGTNAGLNVIDTARIKKVLGSDGHSSVFFMFSDVYRTTIGSDADYFWSSHQLLSLSDQGFNAHSQSIYQAARLGNLTGNHYFYTAPTNLIVALFKYRSAELVPYLDQITFEDEYGFRTALKAAGGQWPTAKQDVMTAAPPEPALSVKDQIEQIREDVSEGAEGLRAQIAAAGDKTIRVISGFGRELDRLAEEMVLAISRDQHRSDVDTAKLSADLRVVANLNSADLAKSAMEPMDNAIISILQGQINAYQPGWFESILVAVNFIAGGKAKLQAELTRLVDEEKEKKASVINQLQTHVDGLLTTTQSFQKEALDRSDTIQGQDAQCDDVEDLLEETIKIMTKVAGDYEADSIERGHFDSRIKKLRASQQAIVNQRAINKGLLTIELMHSDGIDSLGSQMVNVLQRIQQGEALSRIGRLTDIQSDARQVALDVFDEAARIAARFKEAVDVQEQRRLAIIRQAMDGPVGAQAALTAPALSPGAELLTLVGESATPPPSGQRP